MMGVADGRRSCSDPVAPVSTVLVCTRSGIVSSEGEEFAPPQAGLSLLQFYLRGGRLYYDPVGVVFLPLQYG